jgi:ABC-type sugar transport system ATPase subunit
MSDLRCVAASCVYGEVVAVDALDLYVGDGETLALVGDAGAGKTSVVRMIGGIEPAASGRIEVSGADVTFEPPPRRGIAVVFGNSTLSASLTIADHLGMVASDVTSAARAVGLRGLDRKAGGLGPLERQLLALARAAAVRPGVLLLDAVADGLAPAEAEELRDRVRRLGLTTLYTTRDAVDAQAVADRVAVLAGGRLVDAADVHSVRRIDPSFVLRTVRAADVPFRLPAEPVTVALPPSALRLDPSGTLVGTVLAAADSVVFVAVPGFGEPLPVRVDGPALEYVGHRVRLHVDVAQAAFYDAADGRRL